MKKILQDLGNDWSSGLLVKLLAFVFAVELGILCLALGVDFGASLAIVGALVAIVIGFQWVQSATGNGSGPTVMPAPPAGAALTASAPIGIFSGVNGQPDLGRWIKFLAFLAGIAILHIAVIAIRAQVMNALAIAGAFFSVTMGTEIQQKTTGT